MTSIDTPAAADEGASQWTPFRIFGAALAITGGILTAFLLTATLLYLLFA